MNTLGILGISGANGMSFERMDSMGYGYPSGNGPRKAENAPAPPERKKEGGFGDWAGRAIAPASAAGSSFATQWADKALLWGAQDLGANAVNAAAKNSKFLDANFLKKEFSQISPEPATQLKKLGIRSDSKLVESHPLSSKTYSELLHLGKDQVRLGDLNAQNFSSTAKNNLADVHKYVSQGKMGEFFKETSFKSYFKKTLVESNIKPVKELFSNNPGKEVGTGLFRVGAFGLAGYDIVKHTKDTYQNAHSKEDGSWSSKLNTAKETVAAFGKYAGRDLATWEAAGIGAAIGKAIIPIALGGVSVGGIVVGALVGLAAQKGLDYLLKTGNQDPVQQEKALQKKTEAAQSF